jgi:uncharacterized protein (DUF1810 family)
LSDSFDLHRFTEAQERVYRRQVRAEAVAYLEHAVPGPRLIDFTHSGLAEGAKVIYEVVTGRNGKASAENLRLG